MQVTLKQIATRLGVSNQVVSKVLNGGSSTVHASPETRARVVALAQEMGYRPNASARSIRRRRFHQVGICAGVRHGASLLNVAVIDGCLDVLEKQGLRLSVERLDEKRLMQESDYMPQLFRESSLDGLLLSYLPDMPPRLDEMFDGLNAPIIHVNRRLSHDAVYPDQEAGGRMLTEHLLQLGHRRIVYIGAPTHPQGTGHHAHVDRPAGYQYAMRSAGYATEFISEDCYTRTDSPDDLERIQRLFMQPLVARLRQPDRPTAAICYNLDLASATWEAARLAALRVPEDLSLLCFGEGAVGGRQMTCYLQPYRETGVASATMLCQRIEEPAAQIPSQILVGRVRPGDTTASRAGD